MVVGRLWLWIPSMGSNDLGQEAMFNLDEPHDFVYLSLDSSVIIVRDEMVH